MGAGPSVTALEALIPKIGERIARYELLEELGRGGFGVVYRARQAGLDADVAIKIMLPHLVEAGRADELLARFSQEAASAKVLDHPVAIKVRDFGKTASGLPFLVTEFVKGRSLDALILEGPLPESRVVRIADQVLGCLAEAHHMGIVHRDLKPSNIMVRDVYGEADVVKILDFGVAKMSPDVGGVKTQTGMSLGTPHYMAPEQARGATEIDGRADLYALGLVIAECLTGQRVIQGNSLMAIVYEHAREEPHSFPPQLWTSPLFPVVQYSTAKNPAHRFPDAVQMRHALRASGSAWADFTPIGPRAPVAMAQPPPATPSGPISWSGPPPATPAGPSRLLVPGTVPPTSGVHVHVHGAPAAVRKAPAHRGLLVLFGVLTLVMVGVLGLVVTSTLRSNRAGSAPEADSAAVPPPSPTHERAEPAVRPPTEVARAAPTPGPEAIEPTNDGLARRAQDGEARSRAADTVRDALPAVREVRIGGDEGVQVSLDRTVLCETPCTLSVPVVPSRTTLRFTRPGYREAALEVVLAELDGYDVSLEPLPRERTVRQRERPPREQPEPPRDDTPSEASPFGGIR
jgi:serine/threonine protein kinase